MVSEKEATEDEGFRKGVGGAGVATVIECGAGGCGGGMMTVVELCAGGVMTVINGVGFRRYKMWSRERNVGFPVGRNKASFVEREKWRERCGKWEMGSGYSYSRVNREMWENSKFQFDFFF